MATQALDGLDEFFDFARLEADTLNTSPRQQHEPAPPSAHVSDDAMDWQSTGLDGTDVLTTLPVGGTSNPTYLPHDLNTFDNLPATDLASSSQPTPSLDRNAFAQPDILMWQSNDHGQSLSQSTLPTTSDPFPAHALEEGSVTPVRRATPPQRSATVLHKPASAKRKGPSTRIPVEARQMLEEEFASNPYPCSWEIDIIAHQANLDVKRVRNWYNNTRARKKHTGRVLFLCPGTLADLYRCLRGSNAAA